MNTPDVNSPESRSPQIHSIPPVVLSEETIPSVRGEWYNYRSVFTPERPLGYLMKCKANKDRTLCFAEENPDVDLVFAFDGGSVRICSPDSRLSREMMSGVDIDTEALNRTMIAQIDISLDRFNEIRDTKDLRALVSVCREGNPSEQLTVGNGMVIAITTPTGKYCLMRATEIGPEIARFDSCHILL